MIKLLLKLIIYFFPIIFYFIIVFIVDPYQYFHKFNIIPVESKKDISGKINPVLWKILRFKEQTSNKIILGDSRALHFNKNNLKSITNENFSNLAYGGASLIEMIKTFWWIDKQVNLEKVFFCLNFNHYNSVNFRDRVSGVINLTDNVFLYLTNRNTFSSTYYLLKSRFTNTHEKIGTPKQGKEAFWDHQLNSYAKNYYSYYKYPLSLFNHLKSISKYCQENGIKLYFLIPPIHVSLQEKITEYGVGDNYKQFLTDIEKFGVVYDFNFPNAITKDRNNFRDPVHCRYSAVIPLIKQVWGNEN